jgi:D-alanyl-D-alanine carboxypeptidase
VSLRVTIRPAVIEDLEALSLLRNESILGTKQSVYGRDQLLQWAQVKPTERLMQRIRDACVLVACTGNTIIGTCGLDLDRCEVIGLFVHPSSQGHSVGRRLTDEIERLAVRFGVDLLRVEAAAPAISFYRKLRYEPRRGAQMVKDPRTRLDALSMTRSIQKRNTRYGWRIRNVLEQTGIPLDYGRRRRLMIQPEARELATIGTDIHGREQMLQPESAMAWYDMRNAAEADGITLQVASAFRSVGYQVAIIERKRNNGQSIEEILEVSAAPGYSEHHSGKALDLTCPGSEPLEECFENTLAFEWLTENASGHNFRLSYPRNNRHSIAYEPWHWYHQV